MNLLIEKRDSINILTGFGKVSPFSYFLVMVNFLPSHPFNLTHTHSKNQYVTYVKYLSVVKSFRLRMFFTLTLPETEFCSDPSLYRRKSRTRYHGDRSEN